MTTFYEQAKKLLFGTPTVAELLGDHLEFRKGKDISHIKRAIQLARKQGMAKTEFEINMLEAHLAKIFKAKKKPKK